MWSSVNIAGTRLRDMCPTAGEGPERDSENWGQLHHEVVNAAYEIIKLKGYTSWGIGIMCAKLADAILKNQASSSRWFNGLSQARREVLSPEGLRSVVGILIAKEGRRSWFMCILRLQKSPVIDQSAIQLP